MATALQTLTLPLSRFAALYPILYRSGLTPALEGAPGCGKSEYITATLPHELQRALGLDYLPPVITENLGNLLPEDGQGYMVPQKLADGRATSLYTEPHLARRVRETGREVGIVFLDEFAQAPDDVQKVFAPLVNGERRIGSHVDVIPPGWRVIIASNRRGDRSGARGLQAFMRNRVCRVSLELDVPGWLAYAATVPGRIHPLVARFVEARPELIAREVPATDEPFASFRSMTNASGLLLAASPDGWSLPLDVPGLATLVAGTVGEATTTELFAFLSVASELPAARDIHRSPLTAAVPDPARLDAQHAAARMAVHYATAGNIDATAQYVARLRREIQTAAMLDLMKKVPGASSPTMTDWIAKNSALVVASLSA